MLMMTSDFENLDELKKIKIKKVDTQRIGKLSWRNNITAEGFMPSYNASGYVL